MRPLDFRLQLLRNSGQIGEAAFARIQDLILFLEKRTGIELNEDNAAMLVTHFAIAMERAYHKESVSAMDEGTRSQVRSGSRYVFALSLLDEWLAGEGMPEVLPNERDFLLLHLCVLLETLKNE